MSIDLRQCEKTPFNDGGGGTPDHRDGRGVGGGGTPDHRDGRGVGGGGTPDHRDGRGGGPGDR